MNVFRYARHFCGSKFIYEHRFYILAPLSYFRRVVGWSMHVRMQTAIVLNALLVALWRPKAKVIGHSDQVPQFTRAEWATSLKCHNLQASMSRRGNGYDDAVAKSFFHLFTMLYGLMEARSQENIVFIENPDCYWAELIKHTNRKLWTIFKLRASHPTPMPMIWVQRMKKCDSLFYCL